MSNTTIVRLKIISFERQPEEITRLLGLACDSSWHRGDFRQNTRIKETKHGWILNSGLSKTDSLDSHIHELLQRLAPHAQKIRELSHVDEVQFSCVIYSDSPPALYFEKEVIKALGELGAVLDVDLYILSDSNLPGGRSSTI